MILYQNILLKDYSSNLMDLLFFFHFLKLPAAHHSCFLMLLISIHFFGFFVPKNEQKWYFGSEKCKKVILFREKSKRKISFVFESWLWQTYSIPQNAFITVEKDNNDKEKSYGFKLVHHISLNLRVIFIYIYKINLYLKN